MKPLCLFLSLVFSLTLLASCAASSGKETPASETSPKGTPASEIIPTPSETVPSEASEEAINGASEISSFYAMLHAASSYFVPDYQTDSTLHADLFLTLLKRDGYDLNGETNRNYNTNGITSVTNITPKSISDERSDVEIFLVSSAHCFLMVDQKIYRYETFGGYHHQICLWDYDGNGVKDLVSYHSYGSGIPYLGVSVLDLTSMENRNIKSVNLLVNPPFSFAYEDGKILLDGEELICRDGEFLCSAFEKQ